MSIENLQKKMEVRFKDLELLDLALTHTSYTHENKMPLHKSNERLEFLGDAVLSLCMAEMLQDYFPDEPEGALSKRRAALVNQKQLAKMAGTIDLGPALKLGKGEEKTGGRSKESLLGDAFEAVIGALYLDQGLTVVQNYLHRLFDPLIPISTKVETSQDYKTRLQETLQRRFKRSPRYNVVRESGPDHSKTFEVKIEFQGKELAFGKGKSKREAEQDAASKALKNIDDEDLKAPQNKESGSIKDTKKKPTKSNK